MYSIDRREGATGISPLRASAQSIALVILLAATIALIIGVLGWIRGLVSAGAAGVKVYPDTYLFASNKTLCLHLVNRGEKHVTIYRVEVGAAYANTNIRLGPGEEYRGCVQLTGALRVAGNSANVRLYTKQGLVVTGVALLATVHQASGSSGGDSGSYATLEGASVVIQSPPQGSPPYPDDIQLTLNGYIELVASGSGNIGGAQFSPGDTVRLEFNSVVAPKETYTSISFMFGTFSIQEITVSRILVNGQVVASNVYIDNVAEIPYSDYDIDLILNIAIVNGNVYVNVVDENGNTVGTYQFSSWSGTLRLEATSVWGFGFIRYQNYPGGPVEITVNRLGGTLEIVS